MLNYSMSSGGLSDAGSVTRWGNVRLNIIIVYFLIIQINRDNAFHMFLPICRSSSCTHTGTASCGKAINCK